MILGAGTKPQQELLSSRGVRTNLKLFYDTTKPTDAQRSGHARALQTLAKRGFILLPASSKKGERRPPATHVRLTPAGRVAARLRTERERIERLEQMVVTGQLPDVSLLVAPDARELLKRFSAMERDAKALLYVVQKYAPASPMIQCLTAVLQALEEAERQTPFVFLSEDSSPEYAHHARNNLAKWTEHARRVEAQLASELAAMLNMAHV